MLGTCAISRPQHGSSLLEVLVSMIILAIGILGIGAMQTSSLKSNQSSYLRTQAVFHGLDIVERMRSNLAGVQAGDYDDPTPALTAACLTAAGCTATQLAAHDVAEWEAGIEGGLPAGAATVCLDSDPSDGTPAVPACDSLGAVYAIKIWWDDNRDGTAEQKYVMSFQP
jgi:type IV pilus assembly protein PilV